MTIDSRKVFDILVEECGAYNGDEYAFKEFDYHWPRCNEFRFIGNQGFGGKIWEGSRYMPPYVSCNIEDDNPERKAARERANARLSDLWAEVYDV